ncbi:MAG: two-component sensor histidine kinase [Rhodospirillaceae bacterium]|nr:two-component sensor histidine kinase [Rhodospirillaceae bacterium]
MFKRDTYRFDSGGTGLSVIQAGRLHLRTLILLRWVAAAGQTATVIVVDFGLGFDLPLVPCLAAIITLVASNLILARRGRGRQRISDREAVFLLGFDVVQLSALLYLTGGLANPFVTLIIAPAMVSATILSRSATIGLILLAMLSISLLGRYHLPLPWSGWPLALEPTYLLGIWTSLAVAVVFIATYVWSVSEEARRMSDALAATQSSLAREQRISALGGLAAAAAHELGSPLATIAVVAKELSQEVPKNSPFAEDVELLLSQSDRCREIITGLAKTPEAVAKNPFARLPFLALVKTALSPYNSESVAVVVQIDELAKGEEPYLPYGPELVHGLGNLIQNAIQFAENSVALCLYWDLGEVRLIVQDDGAWFAPSVLSAIGEPYISTRTGDGENLGLGIFIAQTLLQKTGANLTFTNEKGAKVVISWPRAILEETNIEGEGH